jgi:hypothetical protein
MIEPETLLVTLVKLVSHIPTPAERQLRATTAPHNARPRPPRRYQRASAVE